LVYLNYLTFRSKVITVRNTPPYGHAPTYRKSGNFGHGFILAYFGP
jgi:hypothetical protein